MMTFSDKLDLLIEKAPGLREAGVLNFEIDGCKVELARPESKLPAELQALVDDDKAEREGADPMGLASTFGLPTGAALPGFKKLIDRKLDDNA